MCEKRETLPPPAVASVTLESWWEAPPLFHTALKAARARDTSHTAADNRHCVSRMGLVREAGPRPSEYALGLPKPRR